MTLQIMLLGSNGNVGYVSKSAVYKRMIRRYALANQNANAGNCNCTSTSSTVQVGKTTTLPYSSGVQASVTNSGTSTNAIFDFSIPQGEPGNSSESGIINGTSLTINGSANKIGIDGDTMYDVLTIQGNMTTTGNITTTDINQLSDFRLKTNIKDLSCDYTLDHFEPKEYEFKSDETKRKRWGFIAQDVEKHYPHLVQQNKETGMLSVNYTEVIPLIVKEINDIKKQLKSLK